MKTLSKALVGTVVAGAMAMGSATPAFAQRDRDDGIDTGDVIAGALILGGIAAVVAATNGNDRGYNDGYVYEGRGYDGRNNDGRYYNNGNRYDGRGYNNAGNSRQAVEQCVYAAERNANRYSYGGRSQVTDIRQIDRKRDGYTVKGRIAVNTRNANWQRGWGNDYRGYSNGQRGYDAGSFTCKVRYGQVVDLDYSGVRGLG
ncbi:MAG TPA: hypothetical protein VI168_14010 [Croceibacterium sp.]